VTVGDLREAPPRWAAPPPPPAQAAGVLVERVRRRLAGGPPLQPGELRTAVAAALRDEGVLQPAASFAATVRAVADELTGLGPLAPLLADPAVTDVLVNGPGAVWVERDGRIQPVPVRFASAATLAALVQRVVAPLGLRVDEARPWVDARLPGGERFHAVLPPLAPDGPVVTIRAFARRRLALADLIGRGALDAATARLLEAMVVAGVAIAVSGGTTTGKHCDQHKRARRHPIGVYRFTAGRAASSRNARGGTVAYSCSPREPESMGNDRCNRVGLHLHLHLHLLPRGWPVLATL
jgi:Type II/IV secretion system protein